MGERSPLGKFLVSIQHLTARTPYVHSELFVLTPPFSSDANSKICVVIESLMGRTNSEIMKIKDAFSDQRYNNSLEKCMQTELKKDKFRNAVLLALEEKRMSEGDKLSIELVRRDAQDLYRALTAKEGGETAMINIIVVRSDKHLAEVLRVFESQYRKNFAREMIQKSRNLVVR